MFFPLAALGALAVFRRLFTMARSKPTMPLIAVFLVLTAFAISANAIPPLVTTVAEQFNTNPTAFGSVFALQFFAFAVASWTGGWLAARFGLTLRSLVTAGLFAMAGLLGAGVKLPSTAWFALWAMPLGYAGGLSETFGSVMIAKLAGPGSSKMMNLAQVFYCLGAILAPQLAAVFLAAQWSWQAVLIALAAMVFVIAVIFVIFTRDLHTAGPTADASPPTPRREIPLLSDKGFHLLAAALFLYVTVECSIFCWIAAFFENHLNVAKNVAATRLRDVWIGLVVGRTIALILPRRWTLWPVATCGVLGMLIGCALLSFPWPVPVATGLIVLYGVAAGPLWPVTVVISQNLRHSTRFTAAVIGAGALGASVGPLLSGWVIKNLGYAAFFPAMTVASTALVATFLLARHAEKKPPTHPQRHEFVS